MKSYIGVDLGGTLVRVAKILEDGKILDVKQSPSMADKGPEIVLDNIVKLIKSLDNYDEAVGVGVGIPGPVDTKNGVITMGTNLKDFAFFPVVKTLEKALNKKVFMDNDANVAGLAEASLGVGKDVDSIYYITISTGIGGAFVYNKQVVSGQAGFAGEVANIVVCESDEKVNHLNLGAVENEASGLALVRRSRQLFKQEITSAKEIFELARNNDETALNLVDDMARKIALMMANVAHVVDPHMFVLGGGITKSADIFLDKLTTYFYGYIHDGMKNIEIRLANLDEPGIVGAAMLPKSFGL